MAEKFLEIPGVETACEKAGYEKFLELSYFSFGGFHAPHDPSQTGHSGGKVSVAPISFQASGGKQSTLFMEKATTGTHIPKMVVHIAVQTGANTLETIETITLETVYVTSYTPDYDGDGPGQESVSIVADVITVDKKVQGNDGALTAVGNIKFDVRKAQTN